MSTADPDAHAFAEELDSLSGRRIVVIVTGSLSAAYFPYWLAYLDTLESPPETRVLLTRAATQMVSRTSRLMAAGGQFGSSCPAEDGDTLRCDGVWVPRSHS